MGDGSYTAPSRGGAVPAPRYRLFQNPPQFNHRNSLNHRPLPGGFPRCGHRYCAIDDWGLAWGRCTSPASKRVKVIESNGTDPSSYEAKLCTSCAAAAATGPENIEIVGELEAPARVLGQVDFPGRYPEDDLRRRIRDFSI